MGSRTLRIGLTITVLTLALGGLLWSSLIEGTEYYKHVEEIASQPANWYGKRVQLHGYVVPGSILRKPNSLEYQFRLESRGAVLTARYTGIVPDTFKDGSEVVLKGHLQPGGRFSVDPNGVMAKCPSKYEPKAGSASRRISSYD